MDRFRWEEGREQREREALERHDRLHRLFKEDRFAFELERKAMLEEFFDGVEDEGQRNRLMELQAGWDKKMRSAGSAHNRFVLAQTLFWKHFHETWHPAIRQFDSMLNSRPAGPRLKRVK